MKNTLDLNFEKPENIDSTIAALEKISPVKFTHKQTGVNIRHINNPEYAYIKATVILTFESEADCREFMRHPGIYDAYQTEAAK